MLFRTPTTRRTAAAFALVAMLPLGSCTVNPATGKSSFTGFMSPEDELRVGREEHEKIIKSSGVYTDGPLSAYVRELGLAVGRISEISGYSFTVTVLNDDAVNAFALPGGYVYVNRGLLALAENEAEAVGVLAHEVGHVVARHTAQRYSQAMTASIGMTLLDVVAQMAGAPAGSSNIAGVGAQLYLQSFSREQELEADMLGIRYMTRLGYSPEGMVTMFRKMERQSQIEAAMAGQTQAAGNDLFASHPRTEDRIREAIALSGQAPANATKIGREPYLKQVDGLIFGDDPKDGVRRGRTFSHAGLGITFTVPPGYTLYNSPSQVVARGPQGAIIVFDMEQANRARGATDLRNYLSSMMDGRVRFDGVESITVNGLPGATGHARVNTQNGVVDLRPVVIRDSGGQIFRLLFLTPPSRTQAEATEHQRTTYSFRKLTASEADAIKPLRIRVVMAETNDTADKLAQRMATDRFQREWFEALNGLPPGGQVQPGRLVKIVSE